MRPMRPTNTRTSTDTEYGYGVLVGVGPGEHEVRRKATYCRGLEVIIIMCLGYLVLIIFAGPGALGGLPAVPGFHVGPPPTKGKH